MPEYEIDDGLGGGFLGEVIGFLRTPEAMFSQVLFMAMKGAAGLSSSVTRRNTRNLYNGLFVWISELYKKDISGVWVSVSSLLNVFKLGSDFSLVPIDDDFKTYIWPYLAPYLEHIRRLYKNKPSNFLKASRHTTVTAATMESLFKLYTDLYEELGAPASLTSVTTGGGGATADGSTSSWTLPPAGTDVEMGDITGF